MDQDIHAIVDQLRTDPTLAKDVARWMESSKRVDGGPFVAYREDVKKALAKDSPQRILRRYGGPNSNRLYRDENLAVLSRMVDSGESVRCIYIDPPYGTKQSFERKKTRESAYDDVKVGSAYLSSLRSRLELLRELLAEDGTMYLHLDSSMVAEAKVLTDELFGRTNFQGWIARRKCSSKNYTKRRFGDVTDFILMYSKTSQFYFERPFEPRSETQLAIDFPKVDVSSGRRFALVPVHAPGVRNGETGKEWRGMLPPPGKHWQWAPSRLEESDRKGDIHWTRNGTPRRKVWADESKGTAVSNLWLNFRDPFNQNFSVTGYPTEKNEELLRRIISASSEPGDLILDCFSGSGTTLAAASALRRRWVGVDKGHLAIALTQKRLATQALSKDLLSEHENYFFDLCTSESIEEREYTKGLDVDFGVVTVEQGGDMPPLVIEVLDGEEMPARLSRLQSSEKVYLFDKSGSEMSYVKDDSIQAMSNRPA